MGLRFNPPPNWPPPPPGFVPPPRWQPDPAWPAPPPGWQLWVPDDTIAAPEDHPGIGAGPRDAAARRGELATDPRNFPGGSRDFPGGAGDFPGGSRDFAGGAGAPAAGAGEFAAGRGEFAGGPGEFAAPRDFGGPGDFGPGAPTQLDPMGPPGAYPGQPGGHGPGPGPGPRRGGTNGFAIAAFVISLLGGTLLSLILGFVALGQIRRSPQRGRGLAIASIVLSVIWGAVLAFFLVGHSSGTPNTPSANGGGTPSAPTASPSVSPSGGGSASPGTASVFALRTGQCFQNPPASQSILGITTVAVVPCTTPHNAQVFVEFAATGGSTYPGRSALKRQADTGCHARIAGNVKSSKITNSMTLRFLYPLSVSWAEGHRTITCLIVDAKPDLKSSLLRAHPKH